jgi:hypothetical protein
MPFRFHPQKSTTNRVIEQLNRFSLQNRYQFDTTKHLFSKFFIFKNKIFWREIQILWKLENWLFFHCFNNKIFILKRKILCSKTFYSKMTFLTYHLGWGNFLSSNHSTLKLNVQERRVHRYFSWRSKLRWNKENRKENIKLVIVSVTMKIVVEWKRN